MERFAILRSWLNLEQYDVILNYKKYDFTVVIRSRKNKRFHQNVYYTVGILGHKQLNFINNLLTPQYTVFLPNKTEQFRILCCRGYTVY